MVQSIAIKPKTFSWFCDSLLRTRARILRIRRTATTHRYVDSCQLLTTPDDSWYHLVPSGSLCKLLATPDITCRSSQASFPTGIFWQLLVSPGIFWQLLQTPEKSCCVENGVVKTGCCPCLADRSWTEGLETTSIYELMACLLLLIADESDGARYGLFNDRWKD